AARFGGRTEDPVTGADGGIALPDHAVLGLGRVELIPVRKEKREAGVHAPAAIDLAFDGEIEEVVDVLDLVVRDFPLHLLDGADEVARGGLEAVSDGDVPELPAGRIADDDAVGIGYVGKALLIALLVGRAHLGVVRDTA